ncbi:PfkB family carbohydrate kinase [Dactylosporangium siamense]|uniref:Aminoimidazole riboside kinase n=1 Tax=Dactylosporangium siamense TaxID=685454 RepID=A0A919PVQ5_9ACTN|nr:PfkB family carbohydrate kinase [Dactylosporangium siamense]GIG49448.1 aminoimidazole riboside kinase [Dactylosporangium siamense]
MTGHAVVIGEALVDLLESASASGIVYHPAIGGAPLNVAVGVARLGAPSEFAGSLGDDPWAGRILDFLTTAGVGTRGVVSVPGVATTLAVTTFRGIEPTFRFYGEPPSYGLLDAGDLDTDVVHSAGLLYCGSMCLLSPPVLAAARKAWSTPGPVKVFDPNVRPVVGVDPDVVAEFAATADLVKLSAADAAALWGESPERAAARLLALGAGAVVVTTGAEGALVAHAAATVRVPAPTVAAIDATGAGDATMAGLSWGILTHGRPGDLAGWETLTRVAVHVAGLVCESRGGATSMPTLAGLRARFPALDV